MDGTSSRVVRGSIPWGLVGLIALIVLVESGLRRDARFAENSAEHWGVKKKESTREAVGCDLLCYGDSLAEFAFLPKVIEARSGLTAYNMAVPAGTPAASYFLFRKAIDAGARPRAVVAEFLPLQLVREPSFETSRLRSWPELGSLGELAEFAWSRRDPDFAAMMGLAKLLRSCRSRNEVRESIIGAVGGKESWVHAYNVALTRWNLRRNRGSLVMPATPRVAAEQVSILDLKVERFDPVYVDYADRFFRLAADRGIPVYCLLTPLSPEQQAAYDAAGTTDEHTAFLRRKLAEFPNLIVVDGRHSGYEPSAFVDNVHLNRRGATAVSTDLATLIAAGPGPDRWIALPTFREPAQSDDVEDIDQSRVAINGAARARR